MRATLLFTAVYAKPGDLSLGLDYNPTPDTHKAFWHQTRADVTRDLRLMDWNHVCVRVQRNETMSKVDTFWNGELRVADGKASLLHISLI